MASSNSNTGRYVKPLPPILQKEEVSHREPTEGDSGPLRRSVITPKPWGYEELWAFTAKYAAKVLFVKAGHTLSLQLHERKEETMRVVSGRMQLHLQYRDELRIQEMREADCVHIEPGTIHRIHAVTDCLVIEASSIELNDVVRLQDDYGRA